MCKLCVYKSFNHALLESKISGTISFAQWWVLDLTLETLSDARRKMPDTGSSLDRYSAFREKIR